MKIELEALRIVKGKRVWDSISVWYTMPGSTEEQDDRTVAEAQSELDYWINDLRYIARVRVTDGNLVSYLTASPLGGN